MNKKAILKTLIEKVGPAEGWKGQCFALATAVVKLGLVEGDAVYGMWHGPIAKGSHFEERGSQVPFTNHGWVNLPDGQILDPTRWVFENVEPYIYVGANDHYDEGANRLRVHQPPPDFDPNERIVEITSRHLSSGAWNFVEKLLKMDRYIPDEEDEDNPFTPGMVTVPQLFWLGNRAPDVLAPHAAEVYECIDQLGYGASIPHDNRRMIERQKAKAGAAPSASSPNPRTSQRRPPSSASR